MKAIELLKDPDRHLSVKDIIIRSVSPAGKKRRPGHSPDDVLTDDKELIRLLHYVRPSFINKVIANPTPEMARKYIVDKIGSYRDTMNVLQQAIILPASEESKEYAAKFYAALLKLPRKKLRGRLGTIKLKSGLYIRGKKITDEYYAIPVTIRGKRRWLYKSFKTGRIVSPKEVAIALYRQGIK